MYILRDDLIITRKPHKCFSCGRLFPKGTEMRLQVNNYDNKINNIHTCKTCKEIITYLVPDPYMDDVLEEGYLDYYLDKGQTPEDLLNELKQ
jgi:hypothetical protein